MYLLFLKCVVCESVFGTGAGKSSLVAALLRLSEIEGGSILVDGHNIAGVPLARLRSAIGSVPQTPFLFQVRPKSLMSGLHSGYLQYSNLQCSSSHESPFFYPEQLIFACRQTGILCCCTSTVLPRTTDTTRLQRQSFFHNMRA